MSRKTTLVAAPAFLLLAGVALWLMLMPGGQRRGQHTALSAANPSLEVRYHYDGQEFKPAPFTTDAEFPLRLDAADWSFYAKRIKGAGEDLKREAPPEVYRFVTNAFSSAYEEFYGLHVDGAIRTAEVELGRQHIIRQEIVLRRAADSRGWPSYFPRSVTAGAVVSFAPEIDADKLLGGIPEVDRQAQEQQAEEGGGKPADRAYVYDWALFAGADLFLFQAVAAQPLSTRQLEQSQRLISSMEFNALRGPAPAPAEPTAASGFR